MSYELTDLDGKDWPELFGDAADLYRAAIARAEKAEAALAQSRANEAVLRGAAEYVLAGRESNPRPRLMPHFELVERVRLVKLRAALDSTTDTAEKCRHRKPLRECSWCSWATSTDTADLILAEHNWRDEPHDLGPGPQRRPKQS